MQDHDNADRNLIQEGDTHRGLDVGLDDAMRMMHQALVFDNPHSSPTLRSYDVDSDCQLWTASAWEASSTTRVASTAMNIPQPRPLSSQPAGDEPISGSRLRYRRRTRNNNGRSNTRASRDENLFHEQASEERSPPRRRPLPDTTALADRRADLSVRNMLRELIFSALLSDDLPAPERAAMLDDCRAQAEESQLGVPFREILSEPMDVLGVPPLLYELTSCQPDWEGVNDDQSGTGMEVVLFLIEHWQENVLAHGKQGMLSWVVRQGCLRRFNEEESNRIFQQLRPTVFEKQHSNSNQYVEFDISITSLGRHSPGSIGMQGSGAPSTINVEKYAPTEEKSLDFCTFISVPDFANHLARLQNSTSWSPDTKPFSRAYGERDPGPFDRLSQRWKPTTHDRLQTRVGIEFLASRRAWRLEIDSNALKLELLDGPEDDPGLYVDARVRLVAPQSTNENPFSDTAYPASSPEKLLIKVEPSPIELLLPRALLRTKAASGRGTHAISLAPCFASGMVGCDSDDPRGFDDPRYLHEGTLLIELTVRLSRTPIVSPPTFASFYIPPLNPAPATTLQSKAGPVYPRQSIAGPSTSTLETLTMTDERTLQTEVPVKAASDKDEDEDDMYVDDEAPTLVHEKAHDSGSDVESDWEKIDDDSADSMDEKEGGWVKANYSGKDEAM